MATYGNFNFTGLSGVNLKNTAAIRFMADVVGNESTLSIASSNDAARAYRFPDKSGTFGVTGTFLVAVPAITANSIASTVVTVSGIRVEDGMVCSMQTAPTVTGTRGIIDLISSTPGNGSITLNFAEVVGTATIYSEYVMGYTTAR